LGGGPRHRRWPPPVDLTAERALQEVLIAAAEARLLRSAHDLSDGGLAVALAECCMGGPWATSTFGAIIDLDAHAPDVSDDGFLSGRTAREPSSPAPR
jgi:phosphoribosylformylglycinamidine synthase